MYNIGSYNELEVIRQTNNGVYLRFDEEAILLPQKWVPEGTESGDILKVFVYTDSKDRLIATTQQPRAVVGEFAYLEVIDIGKFGAFLDWGLDKDLLVPIGAQQVPMEKGEKYIVRLCLDQKTNRVFGVSKIDSFLKKDIINLRLNQKVDLLVSRFTDLGVMFIINQTYSGLAFYDEIFEPLKIGMKRVGYIKNIREDGKIDLRMHQEGLEAITDSKVVILDLLKKAGGFLPYHDKSDPDSIYKTFKMSKKVFKKGIGGLFKDKKIYINKQGISLR